MCFNYSNQNFPESTILNLSAFWSRSVECREVDEARSSEIKAWSHVQSLKNSLDEHNLELRVKAAIEAEAKAQQRLAAREAEIADLRQKLVASRRSVPYYAGFCLVSYYTFLSVETWFKVVLPPSHFHLWLLLQLFHLLPFSLSLSSTSNECLNNCCIFYGVILLKNWHDLSASQEFISSNYWLPLGNNSFFNFNWIVFTISYHML